MICVMRESNESNLHGDYAGICTSVEKGSAGMGDREEGEDHFT